jgi:hypothetical protein
MGETMPLTREEILGRKLGHKTVELPDGSGTVVIRALSRNESLQVREAGPDQGGTLAAADNLILHLGLVDPALSLEDVIAWTESDAAGVPSAVSYAIAEISGMVEGAGKSRVPGVRRKR